MLDTLAALKLVVGWSIAACRHECGKRAWPNLDFGIRGAIAAAGVKQHADDLWNGVAKSRWEEKAVSAMSAASNVTVTAIPQETDSLGEVDEPSAKLWQRDLYPSFG